MSIIKKIGEGLKKTVKDVGRETGKAVKDVGRETGKAAKDVGREAGKVVNDIGREAGNAGREIAQVATNVGQEFERWICNVLGKEPGEDCHVSGGVEMDSDGNTVLTDGSGKPSEVSPDEFNFMENIEGIWTWSSEQEIERFANSDKWTFQAPLKELHVTSKFGMRELNGKRKMHAATDYRARTPTPVSSAGPGVVIHAGPVDTFPKAGIVVTVRHPHFIETQYMHLSETNVTVGSNVQAGQQLALTGETGSAKGAPHLHMVVKVMGKRVDPEVIRGKDMPGGTSVPKDE